MSLERERRASARERTFAELFPWRNIGRALMLVLLILGIVVIKRSTGSFLVRLGDLWGTPASKPSRAPVTPVAPAFREAEPGFRIHLAPGLAPTTGAPAPAPFGPATPR